MGNIMVKNNFKLDTVKIQNLLKALEKNKSWLAKEIGMGRQWVQYDMKTGCLSRAHLYAKVFNMDPKDLIK
jgi:hypothetical protein